MVRIEHIQNDLLRLIGWRQSYTNSNIKISDALNISDTGLYFQDIHPLITLENISCIAPDFNNIEYGNYDKYKIYNTGDITKFNGLLYKSVCNNNSDNPLTNKWIKTNPFSEWLEEKTKASIKKAVLHYINEKLIKKASKTLFENKTLFDGTGRLTSIIKNKNNVVGFEIIPIRSKGVTTKINKIGLQFTEPGEYVIYIMHSSSLEPIYTLKLTKTKKNSLEWFQVNEVYLPYESQNNDAGGSWYICYAQSSLPENSVAIRKDKDWSKGPCKACSRREFDAWSAWSRYIEIHPFSVNEEIIGEDFCMWDVENNMYDYNTNYGLNLDISIYCDLTDFIISQRNLFQDVIAKQLAIDMLREFAYNPNVRTNRHSINASRLDILYEIDGDSSSMKKSGLSYQLEESYKALEISTEGIDRVCLPCVNNGIKYRTV